MFTEVSNDYGYRLLSDIYYRAIRIKTWQEMLAFYATNFGENLLFDVVLYKNNYLRVRINY